MENQKTNLRTISRTMINHVVKVNGGEYYFVMPEYYPINKGTEFREQGENCKVISWNGKM